VAVFFGRETNHRFGVVLYDISAYRLKGLRKEDEDPVGTRLWGMAYFTFALYVHRVPKRETSNSWP